MPSLGLRQQQLTAQGGAARREFHLVLVEFEFLRVGDQMTCFRSRVRNAHARSFATSMDAFGLALVTSPQMPYSPATVADTDLFPAFVACSSSQSAIAAAASP